MTFSGRYFDILRRLVGNVSQRCMQDHMGRSLGRLQGMSQGRRQETSFGVTYSTIWVRPQEVGIGRSWDVGRERPWRYIEDRIGAPLEVTFSHPQDVSSGRLLALHRRSYGDVHKTSFASFLRTSSGRNFAEWDQLLLYYLVHLNQLQQFLIF